MQVYINELITVELLTKALVTDVCDTSCNIDKEAALSNPQVTDRYITCKSQSMLTQAAVYISDVFRT
jgi:hypothetical protein